MKNTIKHLLFLALAVTASHSHAQGHGPGHQGPPPSPLMFLFDVDEDGLISEEEIAAASTALQTVDANDDGKITADELRPPGPPPGHRPPPIIAALDLDADGTISAEELAESPESLLELDLNGDGEISPEELRPHGPLNPPNGGKGPHGKKPDQKHDEPTAPAE
jgi:hypothetical protein